MNINVHEISPPPPWQTIPSESLIGMERWKSKGEDKKAEGNFMERYSHPSALKEWQYPGLFTDA